MEVELVTDSRKEDRGKPQPRRDTRRNRQRLLSAVEEVAQESSELLTMQELASRAEISVATAYRYFGSVDDLLAAYRTSVVDELKSSIVETDLDGRDLFDAFVRRWLHLIESRGPAMVQTRSRRGYLERLHAGEESISAAADAWREPVQLLLQSLEIPASELKVALFLCNILFDPREVNDLQGQLELSTADLAEKMTTTYIGALEGWHRHT